MDSGTTMWMLGIAGALILILLAVIGSLLSTKATDITTAIDKMSRSNENLAISIREELKNIHKRQDFLERSHSELVGEHRAIHHSLTANTCG